MMEIGLLLVLLIGIGAGAGVIAGLLGVGGGIILVPAFFYVFGHLGYGGDQLMQVCVATSLATIIATSMRSLQAHHAKGAVDWTLLRAWGLFVVLGAALGTGLAARVSSQALQVIFGILAGIAGLYLAFGRESWRLGGTVPRGALGATWPVGLGFFSAMMGIGGGTFGVPIQTLYAVPIHRAVATSSGLGVLIAMPAVAGFMTLDVAAAPPYSIGAVNLPAFATVIAATLITAPYGARLAHRMDAQPLKRAFAIFITLVALNMLRKVIFV
ncbi:MAG: sulfite exporter TauE/SafE family protein [Cypionkella sp.]|nr:sulfite exporter TauE/SafE family protein [Cypionkella sp.]